MLVPRRTLSLALQTLVAVAVVAAVGRHFATLLRADPLGDDAVHVRPGHLVAAGLLYVCAHAIWGTFFWQMLRNQPAGASLPWLAGVRAYFVSQVGKYVPGKAWVILLRVWILKPAGIPAAGVGVAGTFETLTSMAAGAMVGVALLPRSGLALEAGSAAWFGILAVVALPLCLGVGAKLASRLLARRQERPSAPLWVPPVWLALLGLLQASAGWCLLGLSLNLTLEGLGAPPLSTPDDFAGHLGAVALAYVAGFVALILPGGLGARELLLQQMLARQGHPLAAVGALALRLVWTVAEFAVIAVLWFARPRSAASRGERGVAPLSTPRGPQEIWPATTAVIEAARE